MGYGLLKHLNKSGKIISDHPLKKSIPQLKVTFILSVVTSRLGVYWPSPFLAKRLIKLP